MADDALRRWIGGRVGLSQDEQMHEHVEMSVEPPVQEDSSSVEQLKNSADHHTTPVMEKEQ